MKNNKVANNSVVNGWTFTPDVTRGGDEKNPAWATGVLIGDINVTVAMLKERLNREEQANIGNPDNTSWADAGTLEGVRRQLAEALAMLGDRRVADALGIEY